MQDVLLRGQSPFEKAVRSILQDRLTETQYRRVALLYGFDAEPLSERQTAAQEGCGRPRIQRSRESALRKLRENGELWLLWLLAESELNGGRGAIPYLGGTAVLSRGWKAQLHSNEGYDGGGRRDKMVPLYYPDDAGQAADYLLAETDDDGRGFQLYEPQPGVDSYEADAYNPAPDEMEVYGDGWIAAHEYVTREENPYAPQNRRGKRANPERRVWADRMEQAWRRGWLDARAKIRRAA